MMEQIKKSKIHLKSARDVRSLGKLLRQIWRHRWKQKITTYQSETHKQNPFCWNRSWVPFTQYIMSQEPRKKSQTVLKGQTV